MMIFFSCKNVILCKLEKVLRILSFLLPQASLTLRGGKITLWGMPRAVLLFFYSRLQNGEKIHQKVDDRSRIQTNAIDPRLSLPQMDKFMSIDLLEYIHKVT